MNGENSTVTTGVCAWATNMPLCAVSLCVSLPCCVHLQGINKIKHTALLPPKKDCGLNLHRFEYLICLKFDACPTCVILLKGFTVIAGTDNRTYIVRYTF
jgi:hypothetical protein